jgi:GR25 family glycosyltransferase involved in LPS biosynthesis
MNSFIDKVYYINLDENEDRKERIEKQFENHNITNYERFSAIKPIFNPIYNSEYIEQEIDKWLNEDINLLSDIILNYSTEYVKDFNKNYIKQKHPINRKNYILGALGCKLSYLEIFKKSEKYDNILILEDDAILHNIFNEHINILNENLKKIEYNYDIIWLCPNWLYKNNNNILNRCYSYKYINESFALVNPSISCDGKFGSTQNNAGNIYSSKIIKYINENFNNLNQYEIDVMFRQSIQSRGNTYTTIPNIITQNVGHSNIEEFQVNYNTDIHYKTRTKFNIFTIINPNEKDTYLKNLKNNLQKMIGYEKIYYISNTKLFNNEILHFIDINTFNNNNIDLLKKQFPNTVNHNNIKYFYYMDYNMYLTENLYIFDINCNLILKENVFKK